jgi:hypothetical protein
MPRVSLRPLAPMAGLALLALLGALLVTGCRSDLNVTPIKTLLDDPSRFDKQTVRVLGDVTQSVGILGYGAYRITDESGTITVVTKENGAPRQGAKVGVEGEFRSGFTFGTESIAVILEHGRYTPPAK